MEKNEIKKIVVNLLSETNNDLAEKNLGDIRLITDSHLESVEIIQFIMKLEDEFDLSLEGESNLSIDILDNLPLLIDHIHDMVNCALRGRNR